MNENISAYDDKMQRILDAQSKIKEINEARQADGKEERANEDNDLQLMSEAKTAVYDMADKSLIRPAGLAMLNCQPKSWWSSDTVESLRMSINSSHQYCILYTVYS